MEKISLVLNARMNVFQGRFSRRIVFSLKKVSRVVRMNTSTQAFMVVARRLSDMLAGRLLAA